MSDDPLPTNQLDPQFKAEPGPQPESQPAPSHGRLGRWWWLVGIAIATVIVIVLAPLASSDPDGLERVAEDHGFIGQARNVVSGALSSYSIPGIDDPRMSTILSGLLGVAIVLIVMFVLGRLLARRRSRA